MKKYNADIAIIGAGFSGTMILANLVRKTHVPCSVIIIDKKESFNKGIAYNPSSTLYLLNVPTKRMSAFPEDPDHFLNWVCTSENFSIHSRETLANSFLPREVYRQYLNSIWSETLVVANAKKIKVHCIYSFVENLTCHNKCFNLLTEDNQKIIASQVALATGNQTPSNKVLKNKINYKNKRYFQNPWKTESTKSFESDLNILIIGNGLTMVDTTLGLVENNFQNKIYALSPNGFNVIPHLHNNIAYTFEVDLDDPNFSLSYLLRKVKNEVKKLNKLGITAEPVIDALRSKTQEIWKKLTVDEKKSFMRHLRHIWGVSRHRIAPQVYHKIQNLRINKKLVVIAGYIHNISDDHTHLTVKLFDKKNKRIKTIKVSRIINCTGPQTNLTETDSLLLNNLYLSGALSQDELKLGTRIDLNTFEIIASNNEKLSNFYTLGVNLKGELWESVAVPELKNQANAVAQNLILKLELMKSLSKSVNEQMEEKE